jgi:putative ABC transport system permease protein
VTLFGLGIRNAFFRNTTRSLLTMAGVFVAALAFVFLRTVLDAWYANSEASAADRLVTRNAISLTQPLPYSYRDRVASVPGVSKVTFSNWFGGYYKDKRNFFANFAVEAPTAIEVFQIKFAQGDKNDFLQDRNSCIVGAKLASKYGFKIGDQIPMITEIYPGDWKFRVAGIVESEDASVANSMYFHWARLNEGMPPGRKDQIGLFTILVNNASESPQISKQIDQIFANSDYETHTETEKSFRLQFVSGSSAILAALQAVSLVILVIMALILGNTLAMGLRERTSELGAMRAIGFLPKHVQQLAWIEGAALGFIGGLLGVLLATPVLNGFGRALAEFGFLVGLRAKPLTSSLAVVLATSIGFLASAIPAWSAARMEVVNALRRQE